MVVKRGHLLSLSALVLLPLLFAFFNSTIVRAIEPEKCYLDGLNWKNISKDNARKIDCKSLIEKGASESRLKEIESDWGSQSKNDRIEQLCISKLAKNEQECVNEGYCKLKDLDPWKFGKWLFNESNHDYRLYCVRAYRSTTTVTTEICAALEDTKDVDWDNRLAYWDYHNDPEGKDNSGQPQARRLTPVAKACVKAGACTIPANGGLIDCSKAVTMKKIISHFKIQMVAIQLVAMLKHQLNSILKLTLTLTQKKARWIEAVNNMPAFLPLWSVQD